MNPTQPMNCLSSSFRIFFLLYAIFVTLATATISTTSTRGNETDHEALLSFKSMIHDPNGALASWNNSLHFCNWNGVSCGKRHKRVTALRLYSLGLRGYVSPQIGNLSFLRDLWLWENNFQGTIPYEIGRLSRLRDLDLDKNSFSGSIPSNLSGCFNLEFLRLYDNMLVGNIPKEISFLSKLILVDIMNNRLTGGISSSLGNITSMEELYAEGNPFGGTISETLGHWKNLKVVGFGGCNLHGTIPHFIYNLSRLTILSFPDNNLTGSLSPAIGELLPNLEWLQLCGNKLTGVLPPSISKCLKLKTVELFDNNFTGKLTIDFAKLRDLSKLVLSDNDFGRGEVDDLKFIDSLKNCSILKALNLELCNFQGMVPTSIGNIPDGLAGCTSLTFLSLKGNLLQGMISSSLRSLKGLEVLDISQNNLSGRIPEFLESLPLQFMNLSFNNLEGDVPVVGVFSNASAFSVLGNSRLCGGLVVLRLPRCNETKKHEKRFRLFIIVILVTLMILGISCFLYAWSKKKKNRQLSQTSMNQWFLKVSYNQLLKATDGFSEANLIGKGGFSSVYKGTLEHDDKFVAVKVLHLLIRGAHKSFIAECEAWRNIRHRNLLKIITSCSSVDFQGNDFKAIVYEFMANGSLHNWLHSSESKSRLSLLQRVNILIDVASALDYLHNQCSTSIAHGDIKPSNILLDNDMVAHVGDFGLARFHGTGSNQDSSTGVKGTIGYAPPEYGLGSEITSSGDVYSFGILLLEIMTGKKPTDNIFDEGLSLHKFVCAALPDHAIDVIDEGAIVMQSTKINAHKMDECLTSILKIGVSCSVDAPSERMNIKIVVQELIHILDTIQNL